MVPLLNLIPFSKHHLNRMEEREKKMRVRNLFLKYIVQELKQSYGKSNAGPDSNNIRSSGLESPKGLSPMIIHKTDHIKLQRISQNNFI
jgi:hypothetical protein